jgi:hypothetical protein
MKQNNVLSGHILFVSFLSNRALSGSKGAGTVEETIFG